MKPQDFGLPEKFQDYRPGQLKALRAIQASTRRFIIVQAPWGQGKTAIAATIPIMMNTNVIYTCSTKQLQDQAEADFPYAAVLKGRSNYPTALRRAKFPFINASLCTKTAEKHCRWCCNGDEDIDQMSATGNCLAWRSCPYEIAKRNAIKAPFTIVNTSLLLAEANYIGRLSGSHQWIVYDEGDCLEDSLLSFVELRFSPRFIRSLGLPPPEKKTVSASWRDWAENIARPTVEARIKTTEDLWGVANIREKTELDRMLAKLKFFLDKVDAASWVYEEEPGRQGISYVFKPIFVSDYSSNLFRHAERFLLMSATIISPDQMAKDLGIPRNEFEFVDLASEFAPERRPVFYRPVAAMSNKNKQFAWPRMVKVLDQQLDQHVNRNVLVHTVSASLARYVYDNSQHQARMLIYGNGKGREETLNDFINADTPKVLVAQSMGRGVNLLDDLCRVVILLKVPFPDLGNKQISKRVYGSKDGNSWYTTKTWRELIQMTGRAMRHSKDWSITTILDAAFGEILWKKSKHLAPKWWRDALKFQKGE